MYIYIIKRLLAMIPVLLGVSFIVFFLLGLAPGDAVSVMLGSGADPVAEAKLMHEFGLDRPLHIRYLDYIYNLFIKFDFGKSFRTRQPIVDEIVKRAPISLTISMSGIFFAALIGVPLGVLSAVKQYSLLDTGTVVTALMFSAVPVFWLAMLLTYFLSLKAGWLPSYGLASWKNYILPILSIVVIYSARIMRYSRSSMLEAIRQYYIRTARAKGATENTVIFVHALKNAFLPIITVIGSLIGALIGGAIVIENLFSIPGLGSVVVSGINTRDIPMVMGASIVIAAFYCTVLLLVDLFYAAIDPRIKARYLK